MLCLRCGRCCLYLDIFIVNPSSIKADGSLDADDQEAMIFKPAGKKCPHLVLQLLHPQEGEGSIAVCTIHHLPCYRGTPCEQFEQMGPEDAVCIMRGYLQDLDER